MDSTDQVMAEAVGDAISRSGNSRKAVAKAVGISERTMARRLAGHRSFLVSELVRTTRFLGNKPGQFLDDALEKLS